MMTTGQTTTKKDIKEAALYYVQKLGFGLCSIPPGTKGPRAAGWNTPALFIDTPEKVLAQFTRHPDHGAGSIHEPSRTCTLDIDHAEWANIMFAEFGFDLNQLLVGGLQISSGRENRAKALYRIPDALIGQTRKAINWPDPESGEPVCVFEFRGGKTQDVLPPSIHPDTGRPYEWINAPWDNGDVVPELPDVLVQLWLNWDKLAPQLRSACPWDKTKYEAPKPPPVQRQADSSSLSIIDQFNDAHDLETMLDNFGYKKRGKRFLAPSSTTKLPGVFIFKDGRHFYSHHGSDFFCDGKRHDAFDLFCQFDCGGNLSTAVARAATILGIDNLPTQAPELNVDAFIKNSQPKASPRPAQEKPKIEPAEMPTEAATVTVPESLLNPPNILGDIAAHCLGCALMPQPIFAVNAALLLVSTIAAQRVQGPTGGRTNLYLASLGASGCGKEYPRTYIKNMLSALNLGDLVAGEEIASGQALLTRAAIEPRSFFQIDEFGLFLQAVTNKQANNSKADIMRQLMSLFTKTDTTIKGTEYANQKQNERTEIKFPCIGLHGSSTEETFLDALGTQHIYDGALNRFIITKTNDPRPSKNINNRLDGHTPPESVREWHEAFENWLTASRTSNLAGINPAAAMLVRTSDAAAKIIEDYDIAIDAKFRKVTARGEPYAPLYARSTEHVYKVALILACGKHQPLIDRIESEWAIEFVDYWTARLIQGSAAIADTEFGSQMAMILDQLGKTGKPMTVGSIFNKNRKLREIPSDKREKLILTLLQNEEIVGELFAPEGGGRSTTKYRLNFDQTI